MTAAPALPEGAEQLLERWLEAVLETPGLTALRDPVAARAVLLDDAIRGVELVAREQGAVVDVGSGGGSPGIPLAAALPGRPVTLVEAERRKCEFLRRWERELPNLEVVWGRVEEQPTERYGVAVARALAPPPVAAEWLLPLVPVGGAVILWVGPSVELGAVAAVADQLAGAVEPSPHGFVVLRKVGATPPGFPRRVGVARKRPLA